MTRRHLLLAAAVLIAAWLAFFGDKTPAGDIAEPVTRRAAAAAAAAAATAAHAVAGTDIGSSNNPRPGATGAAPVILALQARDSLIGGARHVDQAHALFGDQSWMPPPQRQSQLLKPLAPSAPALPFSYLGKKIEDGKWEVYIARGEQTFIVSAGSVVDGSYRVDAITPPTLFLTFLPLNQVQMLTIGEAN
ncbi:hypothetical protein ACFQAT_24705 [Undibacterium arcticum]|uniref:Secretion system X translation initiation factor n=1 Tax=Undibacterium arcticum TaxID=1762892 RepID=A0ABV7F739_9BURK